MGLTVHYHIETNKDWTRRQIRQKLEETRRFAMALPVVSVSEIAEFRVAECDYQTGQRENETPDEANVRDSFRWAKIQAGRYVESPWRPGESRQQAPSYMLCLSIYPAEGCEEMNVGWCSFPRFVWKPEKDGSPCSAGWSQVFRSPSHHRASEKILRGFAGGGGTQVKEIVRSLVKQGRMKSIIKGVKVQYQAVASGATGSARSA